jgi:hypothetical protein
MSPAHGARPQLRAATDPGARSGQLYAPRFGNAGPTVRRPLMPWSIKREQMRTLWAVSERETGMPFDVGAAVRDQS